MKSRVVGAPSGVGAPAGVVKKLDPEDALAIAEAYQASRDIKQFRADIAAAGPRALQELVQQLEEGNLRVKRRTAQVILDRYLEFMKIEVRAQEVSARLAANGGFQGNSQAQDGTIKDPMQYSREEVLKIWRKHKTAGQAVLVRRPGE